MEKQRTDLDTLLSIVEVNHVKYELQLFCCDWFVYFLAGGGVQS